MDYQIKGQYAFVTAGAHGIGEAIANLLTQEGAEVLVADQDEAALREKGKAWKGTFTADLATAAGMDAAIAYVLRTFGRAPDILINNLGLADPAPFEDLSDEMWARAFQINLMGCVRTCRALLPLMAAAGSGSVVNISSDLAKQPEAMPMDYGALQERGSLSDQRIGEAIRSARPRERSHARADLDEAFLAPRRDRRPARRAVRTGPGRRRETIPGRPADAAGDRAAGGCRARRRVPRLASRQVHHRREPRHRGNAARPDLV